MVDTSPMSCALVRTEIWMQKEREKRQVPTQRYPCEDRGRRKPATHERERLHNEANPADILILDLEA